MDHPVYSSFNLIHLWFDPNPNSLEPSGPWNKRSADHIPHFTHKTCDKNIILKLRSKIIQQSIQQLHYTGTLNY